MAASRRKGIFLLFSIRRFGRYRIGGIMNLGFRKSAILVFILVLCAIMSQAAVFASESIVGTSSDRVADAVEKTNWFIDMEIQKAVEKADQVVAAILESNQPEKEAKIEAAIDAIIEHLIKTTDHKVSVLTHKADKEGVEVISELIEVVIYDRTVVVDPCYAH